MAEQKSPLPDLGPKQIKWLRENIKPFNEAWRDVQASERHAERVRARLEADHGGAAR